MNKNAVTYLSLLVCIVVVVLAVVLIPGLFTIFKFLLDVLWFITPFVIGIAATLGLQLYTVTVVCPVVKNWFLKSIAFLLIGAVAICVNTGIYLVCLGPESVSNNLYNQANINIIAGVTIGVYLVSHLIWWKVSLE